MSACIEPFDSRKRILTNQNMQRLLTKVGVSIKTKNTLTYTKAVLDNYQLIQTKYGITAQQLAEADLSSDEDPQFTEGDEEELYCINKVLKSRYNSKTKRAEYFVSWEN